jgi:hypothetical protein
VVYRSGTRFFVAKDVRYIQFTKKS